MYVSMYVCISLSLYIYIYISMCIYIERERETDIIHGDVHKSLLVAVLVVVSSI